MNTIIAFSISAGIFILIFGLLIYFGIKANRQFPNLKSVNVLFRERHASGRSHYNFITKIGGAHGVLEVVVTDQELWLKTGYFFILVAKLYKQVHKIPLTDLIRLERINKRELLIHFRDAQSNPIGYTLKLRDVEGFIAVLPKRKATT